MRRTTTWVTVLAIVMLLVSLVPVSASEPQAPSLVQIVWQDAGDLAKIEAVGAPVYARLSAPGATYFLAGATPKQVETLEGDGLAIRVLDADMQGTAYYLARPVAGRPAPDWNAYGQLLLDDGLRVLLRATPQAAELLSLSGIAPAAVTLTPKPVRPAGAEHAFPTAVEWDPFVQNMIDQVTTAQVSDYDRKLAGELPVWVDGAWYTIPSRYTYSGTPIQKATSYVGQHMAGLGLDVEYHNWSGPTYPNVIGQKTGLINPDQVFMIGAHLDDVQGTPGADDNASGSVATLLAADILSQYQWGCTLRFAFWTGEEQGLLGSYAYAQRAYQRGENIVGYLNLDMIAWNSPGSQPAIDLYYDPSLPPTLQLAQLFADVVPTYDLNLVPGLGTGVTGSDHASFWDYGYTAILGIEDNGDFNPYYHGSGDTPAHTDLAYFTDFSKASIATYAHMSGCLIPGGIGSLDGHVLSAQNGAPVAGAALTITDPQSHTFTATADDSGYYTRTLVANTYDVAASAYGFLPESVSGVTVLTDTVTTQDFSLQPAPRYAVIGTVTDSVSGGPLAAQIEFGGSPVTVSTDPLTGHYRAVLPQGEYFMHVTSANHRPQDRPIVVNQGQNQSFALEPLPCILLVDDDNDSPDTRGYFANALTDMGYDYDVFDVGGGAGDGPALSGLEGYRIVLWFAGDKYGGSAGPNSADEANLAAYLDGGGTLFLSAQDYLYDFGLTPFGQNYLGIGSYGNDDGDATSQVGIAGDPVGNGLGPYTLTYPSGFTDYGDTVNAGSGGSVAFKAVNNNRNLDVDKAGAAGKAVFYGTDWAPIYNNNAANGRQVLQRIIDWFGGCQVPATMHVQGIKMGFVDRGAGRSIATAALAVRDQAGATVAGALVEARWTRPDQTTQDQQATSNSAGVARFGLPTLQHGQFEFCVTGVVKEGYTYDPSQNGETCDTVTIP